MSSQEDNLVDRLDPGATIINFGKHKGKRFDELPEDYVHWALNRDFDDPNTGYHLLELKRTYELQRTWLRIRGQLLNPLGTKVWFPQKGIEFRQVYSTKSNFESLLRRNPDQCYRLRQLAEEYQEWLNDHPEDANTGGQVESDGDEESLEEGDSEEDDLGSSVMWFGKHHGKRLDELDEHYLNSLLNQYQQNPNDEKLNKWHDLWQAYKNWLDTKHRRISPGSIPIWFGKYRGHEFRVIYRAKRRWEWHLKNNIWAPRLRQIELDYIEWLRDHRRARPTRRAAPIILNPRGKALGKQDDGAASDDGSDMGSLNDFVVASDEEENEMAEETSNTADNSDGDEDEYPETNSEALDPQTEESDEETDSSSSLPSLDALLARHRPLNSRKPSSRPIRRERQTTPESLDEDSDDAPLVPLILSERSSSKKRMATVDATPDLVGGSFTTIEADSDDEPVTPSLKRRRLMPASQLRAKPSRPTGTASYPVTVSSDDEPLLSKYRRR